ncbi:MAG: TraX family protein [Bacilli bacterium]
MENERKFLCLDSLALKIIAALLMTVDHIGLLFISNDTAGEFYLIYSILRSFGKLAFPLFAFLAVEGAYNSKNIVKYLIRLLVLSIILDVFGFVIGAVANLSIASNPVIGNAFTDLFLGVLTITLLRKRNWFSLFALLPIAYALLSRLYINDSWGYLFKTDWGAFSIILFLFYFFARELVNAYLKNKAISDGLEKDVYLKNDSRLYYNLFEGVGLLATEMVFYLLYRFDNFSTFLPSEFVPIGTYGTLACVIFFFYNGKKGFASKKLQYAFYGYYPAHLLILGIISLFFGVLAVYR